MQGKNNVKINFAYNSIYQILLMITPLITSPYVSRTLGSEGIGVYTYTYSIANCFALVGMLGVTNYGNRTIAAVQQEREKRSKHFWNILTLQVITTLIVLVFYLIYVFKICPVEYKAVSCIQILTVLCSLCDINWYFFGVEKFKLTVTRNIIIKILNIVLIFWLVHNKNDTVIYTLIITSSLFLSNLSVWPFLKKEVDFVKPDLGEVKSHLKEMVVLFIPVIAITLYKRMDKIMLGSLTTMSQTGFYENAEKIISIPNSLIAALGTVMLPRISNLLANGERDSVNKYIMQSMEFVCFMACALMFGIAGIAPEFAPWFLGEEFTDVGRLIIAISPTILFISWANVIRTQYLIPLHYDKVYIISVWFGAVINLIINMLLIPNWGAMGAIIGTVIAEAVVMIYQTLRVRNELPIRRYIKNSICYIVAGIIMFILVRVVGACSSGGLKTILLEIFVGVIVYLSISFLYLYKKHSKEVRRLYENIKERISNGKRVK